MTRNLSRSLLIASIMIVAWATTSEACHRRRAYSHGHHYYSPAYSHGETTGYYSTSGGYGMVGGGYYSGGYGGYPGYGYGRPYNPGGLGGPWSGLGVRPGLGFGGFGPGR
jgi:hypothetical protein